MPEPIRCRHIHVEGRQCGSPALRHEKLCYQHHAARRPLARRPEDPLGPILPDPEDLPAVQRGLAELLRLVARGLIETRQAKLLFAILTEAGTNLARIDRARSRQRTLALAEARFAAKYPEAAAELHAKRKAELAHNLIMDLVDDPQLGAIAPSSETTSDFEPQPEAPTPDLLPVFARDNSPADEHARSLRDQAEAAAQAEFERQEEVYREERRSLRQTAQNVYRSMGWTHMLTDDCDTEQPADDEVGTADPYPETVDHPPISFRMLDRPRK